MILILDEYGRNICNYKIDILSHIIPQNKKRLERDTPSSVSYIKKRVQI